jgi:AraC-like DNA-binding protein
MLLSREVWSVLLIYGVLQGTLLAGALLINPRGRRLANVLLAGLLLISVVHALPYCLLTIGVLQKFPHMISVAFILVPGMGPLFYFYTRALLRPDYTPRILLVAIATLAPGLARFIEWISAVTDMDEVVDGYYHFLESGAVPIAREDTISLFIVIAYTIVFLFAAWRLIKRMEHELSVQYAGATRRHFKWLKFLAAALLVIKLHAILTYALVFVAGRITVTGELTAVLVKCLFVQSVAFVALLLPEGVITAVGDLPVRSRRTSNDVAAADANFRALQEIMGDRKPYRIESLRLSDLAAILSIPSRELSELINDRLQTTFCDFVNTYRVADAKAMLGQPANDQFTLVAVAREAGFSSKSSFNRVFKNHTGMSPSEYRNSIRPADRSAASTEMCEDSPG